MVKKVESRGGWHEAWGLVLLSLGILILLSLLSYDPGDIGLLKMPPNRPPSNFIGPLGAWTAFGLIMGFGLAAFTVPAGLFILGGLVLFQKGGAVWPRALWMLEILAAFACLLEIQETLFLETARELNAAPVGGIVGLLLGRGVLEALMGDVGSLIVVFVLLLVGIIFAANVRPVAVLVWTWARLRAGGRKLTAWLIDRGDAMKTLAREQQEVARKRRRIERALSEPSPGAAPKQVEAPLEAPPPKSAPPEPEPSPPPKRAERKKKAPQEPAPDLPDEDLIPADPGDLPFLLPPMDLLDPIPPEGKKQIKGDFREGIRILQDTLNDFGVDAQVTHVEQGPVVTRYQVLPAAGVRVDRIAKLSNDIARTMKAVSVRVQAPIPGKGVVGIEVPNATSTLVALREMLESEAWTDRKALPLALGKDVSGRELVADLADAPHMLIAGATGSGKTVCMNSILAGLLMSRRPDQMRLMLIDPKIVEFSGYNHLPHLVVPVITDPKKVSHGLRWAINEMEKRYKLFARAGVRNIRGFNTRPIIEQTDLFGEDAGADKKTGDLPRTLPYIVIVVDELADLMMVAQAEIETAIARLAQLSRAVGIHMILATQRPSVNVITGTIKANFPVRLAFQVAQGNDSRTILDAVGAEKLLGKGDMLFLPPGTSKLVRAQGTFTTDSELHKIVDFLKKQGEPEYVTEIKEKMEDQTVDIPDVSEDDELLDAAIEIVRQTRRASTSSLQRRLRIGYTRAARIMDLLEEKGLVGPPRGSDPREILIDLDGDIPENSREGPETDDEAR
jgi:DNA segregation ATPase FtsK/SpoIIIE, S-DNA-T family